MKNTMTSAEIEEQYHRDGIMNRQWLSKEFVEKCIKDLEKMPISYEMKWETFKIKLEQQ